MGFRMWDRRCKMITPVDVTNESMEGLTAMMSQVQISSSSDRVQGAHLLAWQCIGGKLQEDELLQYVDSLPSHWTICTLAVTQSHSHLLLCRYQPHQPPTLLAVPLFAKYDAVWEEFRSFLSRLGSSNSEAESSFACRSSATESNRKRTDRKRRWWEERRLLDEALSSFLSSLQAKWLGCWKVKQ